MAAPATAVSVTIQEADFDIAALQHNLLSGVAREGAVATFTGYVRTDQDSGNLQSMELEHYPGMTQKSIKATVMQAASRWPLLSVGVVHRVGRLFPGDQIVWVGVAAQHRGAALSACEYVMDYLKVEAPLWKKEFTERGEYWVEAKQSDAAQASRWTENAPDKPVE